MGSLVLELQEKCTNESIRISSILRDAYLIARKLNQDDLVAWIKLEMNGYTASGVNLPDYRRFPGTPKAQTILGNWVPLVIEGFPEPELLRYAAIPYSISEIEEFVQRGTDDSIISYPDGVINAIQNHNPHTISAGIMVRDYQFNAVLGKVRSTILEWSLELEKRGILGEGLTFSKEERVSASNVYHINTFHGILGNVSSSNVHIGDYATIHNALKDAGVPTQERHELENIIEEARALPEEKRKGLASRATAWIGRNKLFLLTAGTEVTKLLHDLKIL